MADIKKQAFTLAEVLVVLALLGTVAAMTIPSLMTNTENNEHVNALLKAYSSLANATSKVEIKAGPVKYWTNVGWDKIQKLYVSEFNIIKNCEAGEGCFEPKYTGVAGYYQFVTADGMSWGFMDDKVIVDVNGLRPPNKEGRDIFGFNIDSENDKGIVPMSGDCSSPSLNCTEKIIFERKMKY